jgi:peptidoglycan/LPS O-acetylase OafA/YrhL
MRRIAGLDELRGISILAVVVGHHLMVRTPLGEAMQPRWALIAAIAAVDLFFVISGFLITMILVSTKGKPGYFRQFYSRRALRILPLALVVIAVSYVAFPTGRHLVWGYLLFYNNYQLVAVRGEVMPGLAPMWSLAVEEQFYIVFPLLVALVPRRHLWLAVLAICGALVVGHYSPNTSVIDGMYLSDGRTHIRALPIALGALLALLRLGLVPRPGWLLAGLGAWWAGWAVATRAGGALDVPLILLFVAAVWLAVSGRFALRSELLEFFGVRCYGLYLLHPLVLVGLAGQVAPLEPWPLDLALYLLACTVLATLSFGLFERPLLELVPSQARRRRSGAGDTPPRYDMVAPAPAINPG